MMLVDDRTGSAPLLKLLEKRGIPCIGTRLAFGDFAFEGNGPNDTTLQIGIEYKTLADYIASVRSGRLTGHQLRGMRDPLFKPGTSGLRITYDRVWLVVEGEWRSNEHGRVCTFKGPRLGWRPVPGALSASELEKRYVGLGLRAGVFVWPTANRECTVRYLTHLYRDLTDGPWEGHTSHLAPHVPVAPGTTEFQEAVMRWPGVGVSVSKAAQRKFGSVKRAAMGSVQEWANLTTTDLKGGKRVFGEPHARKVIDFLVKSN